MHDSTGSLRAALGDRLAAQWIALGVTLAGEAEHDVIDLEALVALTAQIGRDESRLYDGALDWCVQYGTFLNVSRLRTVADEIGGDPVRLAAFSGLVASAGGPKWAMAGGSVDHYQRRGKVHVRTLREPARLAWRLRAAFGVTARADILTLLVSLGDREITVADIARAVRFTKRNVTLTVRSLALADVLELNRVGNELRVKLTADPGLRHWLGTVPAGQVDWVARFAVARSVIEFVVPEPASLLVRAIEARALVARLEPTIRRGNLPMPDTTALGETFNAAFDQWRSRLAGVFGSVQQLGDE